LKILYLTSVIKMVGRQMAMFGREPRLSVVAVDVCWLSCTRTSQVVQSCVNVTSMRQSSVEVCRVHPVSPASTTTLSMVSRVVYCFIPVLCLLVSACIYLRNCTAELHQIFCAC